MASIPNIWSEESLATAEAIISSGAVVHYERLKVVLWVGVTTFSLALSWSMVEFRPPEDVLLFWTWAKFVALFGFYLLFIYRVPNTYVTVDIMKIALWALSTTLNIIFVWRMVKTLPLILTVCVYAKTAFVFIWGFYALFLSRVAPSVPILPR